MAERVLITVQSDTRQFQRSMRSAEKSVDGLQRELNESAVSGNRFDRSLRSTGASMRRSRTSFTSMRQESSRLSIAMGSLRTGVGGLSSGMTAMGPAAAVAGAGIAAVGAAAVVAAREIGESVKTFVEYESSLSRLRVLGFDLPTIDARISKQARELGADLNALADAYYQARSAQVAEAEIAHIVETAWTGKIATGADLSSILKTLALAMNTFNDEGLSAERVLDLLIGTENAGLVTTEQLSAEFGTFAAVMKAAGFTLQETLTIFGTLAQSGRSPSEVATQMEELGFAVESLRDPTSKLNELLEEQGIAISDTDIAAGRVVPALYQLQKQMVDNTEELKTAIGGETSYQALLALTAGGLENYRKAQKAVEDAHGAGARAAAANERSLGQVYQRLQSLVKLLRKNVGASFAPGIIEGLQPIIDKFEDLNKWFEDNPKVVEAWSAAVSSMLKQVGEEVGQLIGFFGDFAKELASTIIVLESDLGELEKVQLVLRLQTLFGDEQIEELRRRGLIAQEETNIRQGDVAGAYQWAGTALRAAKDLREAATAWKLLAPDARVPGRTSEDGLPALPDHELVDQGALQVDGLKEFDGALTKTATEVIPEFNATVSGAYESVAQTSKFATDAMDDGAETELERARRLSDATDSQLEIEHLLAEQRLESAKIEAEHADIMDKDAAATKRKTSADNAAAKAARALTEAQLDAAGTLADAFGAFDGELGGVIGSAQGVLSGVLSGNPIAALGSVLNPFFDALSEQTFGYRDVVSEELAEGLVGGIEAAQVQEAIQSAFANAGASIASIVGDSVAEGLTGTETAAGIEDFVNKLVRAQITARFVDQLIQPMLDQIGVYITNWELARQGRNPISNDPDYWLKLIEDEQKKASAAGAQLANVLAPIYGQFGVSSDGGFVTGSAQVGATGQQQAQTTEQKKTREEVGELRQENKEGFAGVRGEMGVLAHGDVAQRRILEDSYGVQGDGVRLQYDGNVILQGIRDLLQCVVDVVCAQPAGGDPDPESPTSRRITPVAEPYDSVIDVPVNIVTNDEFDSSLAVPVNIVTNDEFDSSLAVPVNIATNDEFDSSLAVPVNPTTDDEFDSTLDVKLTPVYTSEFSLKTSLTPVYTSEFSLKTSLTPVYTSEFSLKTSLTPVYTSEFSLKTSLTPVYTSEFSLKTSLTPVYTSEFSLKTSLTPVYTSEFSLKTSLTPVYTSEFSLKTSLTPVYTSEFILKTSLTPVYTSEFSLKTSLTPVYTSAFSLKTTLTPVYTSAFSLKTSLTPVYTSEFSLKTSLTPVYTSAFSLKTTLTPVYTSAFSLKTSLTPVYTSEFSLKTSLTPVYTSEFSLKTTLTPVYTSAFSLKTTLTPVYTSAFSLKTTLTPVYTSAFNLPTTLTPVYTSAFNLPTTLTPVFTSAFNLPTTLTPVFTSAFNLPTTLTPVYDSKPKVKLVFTPYDSYDSTPKVKLVFTPYDSYDSKPKVPLVFTPYDSYDSKPKVPLVFTPYDSYDSTPKVPLTITPQYDSTFTMTVAVAPPPPIVVPPPPITISQSLSGIRITAAWINEPVDDSPDVEPATPTKSTTSAAIDVRPGDPTLPTSNDTSPSG